MASYLCDGKKHEAQRRRRQLGTRNKPRSGLRLLRLFAEHLVNFRHTLPGQALALILVENQFAHLSPDLLGHGVEVDPGGVALLHSGHDGPAAMIAIVGPVVDLAYFALLKPFVTLHDRIFPWLTRPDKSLHKIVNDAHLHFVRPVRMVEDDGAEAAKRNLMT